MNAVSPFSLFDKLTPARALGAIAGEIAESAKGQKGLAGAFSEAWDTLDANDDGALNARDVIGHAVGVRNAALQGLADAFGYDTSPGAKAMRDGMGEAAGAIASGAAVVAGRDPRDTSILQHIIASAPPALPSAPAARAVENLPGIDAIRAAYTALRNQV